jgi:prepilin-type N-terminal cleavage/methylation domain-containing protein
MRARGFTLVEILVVTGIFSLLLAFAVPLFSQYMKHYRIEAQTRMIYTELLQARANALFQRRALRVKLYRDRFEVYSSSQDSGAAPVQTVALSFPITSNGHGDGVKGYPIDFDVKGLSSDWCSICLEAAGASGAIDSVVISPNRVGLGEKDKGDACTSDNISKR